MTPEEHYAEAERLAGPRGRWYYEDGDLADALIARAQVHATLALAGATMLAALPVYREAQHRLVDAMLGTDPKAEASE